MSTYAGSLTKQFTATLCSLLLVASCSSPPSNRNSAPVAGAQTQAQGPSPNAQSQLISADQLDSLVAPIALYPDPLLAQVLVASTYPLEVVQLQEWLAQHNDLKGQALTDAVMKENWDPSIQALAALPDVVKLLADNIQWTSDLGNAFLAQQSDVMDAVQRMRLKAKNSGKLTTTEHQTVQTQVVDNQSVIVIEPSNPEVIYVPSYNPVVVYGPAPYPYYPYPPIYYPPGYYVAGMAISFGIGLAIGATWGRGWGGWGWGCGWGGNNNIYVNNNNNFVRNSNINNINRSGPRGQLAATGRSNWQFNPQHRGGAPYSNRQLANKYGGTYRGESLAGRQAAARQRMAQRPAQGLTRQQPGQRPFQGQARQQPFGGREFSAGARNMPAGRQFGGGSRVGNRQVSPGWRDNAFGGAGNRMSGSGARMSGSRGASSMRGGARGGGGRRR
jgi:hypothetical protein